MLLALALCTLSAAPPFDAKAAWAEAAKAFRDDYAYFSRPGVDGEALLAAFEQRALATRSRAAFVDVLQLLSHDFADPHVVVGPFDPTDWSVIPTNSDLFARWTDEGALVLDVRAESAAATAGLTPGARVTRVDGKPLATAVEQLTGLPLGSLSQAQRDHATNIALAGIYGKPRQLVVDGAPRTLEATAVQARAVSAGPRLSVRRAGRLGVVRLENSLGDVKVIADFTHALDELRDVDALVVDLRNTPSGGTSTVARGILGHFVDQDRPYQLHTVPGEERQFGVRRKFVEYVLPLAPRWTKPVYAVGGRWTSSMGEGLMIGFDAIGVPTVGSALAHLLGATETEIFERSGAKVDLPTEALFHVDGRPRETFVPSLPVEPAERTAAGDPALARIEAHLPPAR